MAVPTHFKFTFRGVFDGTPEGWSFGCKMSRDNPLSDDAHLTDIDQDGVTAAVVAFFAACPMSSLVKLSDWRAYVIGTDGRMEGNAPLIKEFEGAARPHGTNATVVPFPQVAHVVTMMGAERGPAQYGRMYLPGVIKPLSADMRLSVADAGDLLTASTDFLKAVSDCIDLEPPQSSEGLNVSPGPPGSPTGTRQAIDHLEFGRVTDTMKSRRRSLLEERVTGGHIDW